MMKKSEEQREIEEWSKNSTKQTSYPLKFLIKKKRKSKSSEKKDKGYIDDDIFVEIED
ncbi:unnamed protein product [Prunus brigantina]